VGFDAHRVENVGRQT